jgi:hypothetical protein
VSEWTLQVGRPVAAPQGPRFAKLSGSPLVFTLNQAAIGVLTAELHDRKILAFPADEVSHVKIQWPGLALGYSQAGRTPEGTPRWEPDPGSESVPVASAKLTELVSGLAGLRAERFTQYHGALPGPAGLDPSVATVEVTLSGSGGTHRLRLGRPAAPGLRYATTAAGQDGAVVLLREAVWGPWASPPTGMSDLPDALFAPDPSTPRAP